MPKPIFFSLLLITIWGHSCQAQLLTTSTFKDSIETLLDKLYDANSAVEEEHLLEELAHLGYSAFSQIESKDTLLADLYHKPLGGNLHYFGKYLSAIDAYEKAYDIRKNILGVSDELTFRMDKNIASCYFDLELFEQTIHYYDQAIPKYDSLISNLLKDNEIKELSKEEMAYIRRLGESYMFRGLAFNEIGEFQKAISDGKQSVKWYERLKETRDIIIAYNSLSIIYKNAGNYKEALKFAHQARQKGELIKDKTELPNIYNSLGNIHYHLQQNDSAIYYFNKTLSIDFESKDFDNVGETFTNLSLVYLRENNFDSASLFLGEGLGYYKLKHDSADFHYDYSSTYENLGDLYTKRKKYNQALKYYQLALFNNTTNFRDTNVYQNPNPETINVYSKPDFLRILHLKGLAFYKKYQADTTQKKALAAALATFQQYDKAQDHLQADLLLEDSRLQWIAQAHSVYETAIAVALAANEKEQAFLFAERSKAVLLLKQLKSLAAKTHLPDSLQRQEITLRRKIGIANRELFDLRYSKDNKGIQEVERELEQYQIQLTQLVKQLEVAYPSYRKVKRNRIETDISVLQDKLLPQDAALIEYFEGKEHWTFFLLTRDELKSWQVSKQDFSTNELSKLIALLHEQEISCNDFSGLAYKAYQFLLEQPLKEMGKELKHLIIIPDGQLASLSFETLIQSVPSNNCDFGSLDYILNAPFSLSYAYSANVLLENAALDKQKPKNLAPFLGIALDFKEKKYRNQSFCRGDTLEILSHSIAEINDITDKLGGDKLINEKASVENFLKEYTNYNILHFSTHATQSCLTEEDTRILLSYEDSLTNRKESFTGKELRGLSTNCRLVTFSACETGLGELKDGEGVMSLARDLFMAGTPSVVMSLWSVPDKATKEISVAFYEYLKQGKRKDKALQLAKQQFINYQDFSIPPYYWAALVQVGHPAPLYRSWTLLYIVLFLFLGISILAYIKLKKSSS